MKKYEEFILESKTSILLELENIENSDMFLKWMKFINGGESPEINSNMLISGFCEDLALYLHYKYKVEVFRLDKRPMTSGHYFIKYKNKYYDGYNRKGVNKPSELTWSIKYANKKNIKVESLNDILEPLDFIWSGYKEAAQELSLI